jgi:hypothetical protein
VITCGSRALPCGGAVLPDVTSWGRTLPCRGVVFPYEGGSRRHLSEVRRDWLCLCSCLERPYVVLCPNLRNLSKCSGLTIFPPVSLKTPPSFGVRAYFFNLQLRVPTSDPSVSTFSFLGLKFQLQILSLISRLILLSTSCVYSSSPESQGPSLTFLHVLLASSLRSLA